jgi:hypothetical protein
MKIAPVSNLANLASAPMDQNTGTAVQNFQNLRSMKMRTNYNPTDYEQLEQTNGANALANSPTSDQARVSEDTQPLSPQYAALARQRRALQVKERALAEREKALQTPSGQADSVAIARLKSEPLKVLLEAGVTYDDLTQAILNNPENSELYELRREFDSYKQEIQNQLNERESAAEKQALREITAEAKSLVNGSQDFELIRTMGHTPSVTKLIERTWRERGQLLSVYEACQAIENELFKDAQRVAGLDKVRSQLIPAQRPPQMQRQAGMRTLTNRDTATVPLTARQRAIAAFNGTLKR